MSVLSKKPIGISVKQAADHLGVTQPVVLRLIHAGKIRATNLSSGVIKPRWRIPQDNLKAFIDARTGGGQ